MLTRAARRRPGPVRTLLAGALVAAGFAAQPVVATASADGTAGHDHHGATTTRVVVQVTPGRLGDAEQGVHALGGRLVASQAALDTFVADVPCTTVPALGSVAGVDRATPDLQVHLLDTGVGPTGLAGDMTNVARLTGANTFWRNGFSGQGIDVALLDSGVLPIEGLNTPNKLVIGPDLSFESQQSNLASLDTYGHGTHLAGIIAGRDSGTSPSTYASDSTHFLGMAPGARIVSLKLADAQGRTDVSQVVAAIDWVVEHANDPGLNIRVLNLSFGTDSAQDYRLDPLAHAAEVAWNRGIVVVVSAGNGDGTAAGLADPAYDPAVLAVGAEDSHGTSDRSDDTMASFSMSGDSANGLRGPDLVAPGVSVASLRASGSLIDAQHPTAEVGDRFFLGSGTSQAAAVVSGGAALLLSQRPWLSPDQVKDVLRRSAKPIAGASTDAQGAGGLDLGSAYWTSGRTVAKAALHNGGGSLEGSRGSFHVKTGTSVLSGEQDIFGRTTDTTALAGAEASASAWAGGSYDGGTWSGGGWAGPVSLGATWAGATWAGATWAGATWAGATWAGATWAGATWADSMWASASWG